MEELQALRTGTEEHRVVRRFTAEHFPVGFLLQGRLAVWLKGSLSIKVGNTRALFDHTILDLKELCGTNFVSSTSHCHSWALIARDRKDSEPHHNPCADTGASQAILLTITFSSMTECCQRLDELN